MKILSILFLVLIPALLAQQASFYVYTLSMGIPNQLLVFSGNSTGYLTYVTAVDTGSDGVPAAGPGIQSQNSIVINGTYLFCVNPLNNTISMFSIANPALPTLIDTASTVGDWPNTIAATSDIVCVATSGVVNGVYCSLYGPHGFSPSPIFASLGLNLTNPPVSHTGPAQISFTPDGNSLVISNKGANPPMWLIVNYSNTFNPVNTSIFGKVPFSFAWDIDGTILLTDAAPIGTFGGIELVNANTSAQTISFVLGSYFLLDQMATCWISRSAYSGLFYASNAGSGSVTMVKRTIATNTLVEMTNLVLPGAAAIDNTVVNVNGQDYVIQLSASQQIFVVTVGNQSLTLQQTVNLTTPHCAGIITYTLAAGSTTTVSSGGVSSSNVVSSSVASSNVVSSSVASSNVVSSGGSSNVVSSGGSSNVVSSGGSSNVVSSGGSSNVVSSKGSVSSAVKSSSKTSSVSSISNVDSASTIVLSIIVLVALLAN